MAWEIEVWTPDKATSRAVYSNTSPGGIADGFTWNVAPNGNCMQFTFKAVPASVNIGPRDIVQLRIDGQPAFYGYVTQTWPANDTALREYRAVGAAELLRQRLFFDTRYPDYRYQVSSTIAYISNNLFPPAITPSSSYAGANLMISIQNAFGVSLMKIVDDLSRLIDGVSWGVNADGTFFFDVIDTSETIADNVEVTTLPVIGSDVVTAATVMVGGIPVRYEAPEHATYGAEKSWVYPVISSIRVDGVGLQYVTSETHDGGATWTPWTGDLSMLFDGSDQTGLGFDAYGLFSLIFNRPTQIDSVFVHATAPGATVSVYWVKQDGTLGFYSSNSDTINESVAVGADVIKLSVNMPRPVSFNV